jgi:hypothetical protein
VHDGSPAVVVVTHPLRKPGGCERYVVDRRPAVAEPDIRCESTNVVCHEVMTGEALNQLGWPWGC